MQKLLFGTLSCITMAIYAEAYVDANIGLNTSWGTLSENINGGYMFNKYLGAELGYTYSNGYRVNYTDGNTYSGSYSMFDVAVKGVLPLSSAFALYGKLGIGYNDYHGYFSGKNTVYYSKPEYYDSDVGILIGIGVQYNLSKSWSLHLEDSTVTGTNPNLLMFGAQYSF